MDKAPLGSIVVSRGFNENAYIAYFTGEGQIYTVPQNTFMVFFPEPHRPKSLPEEIRCSKNRDKD